MNLSILIDSSIVEIVWKHVIVLTKGLHGLWQFLAIGYALVTCLEFGLSQ